MQRRWRAFVWLLAIVGSAATQSAAAADVSTGWTVLFRSDNPLAWNTNAGDASTANGYVIKLISAPLNMRFLRLTRMDTGDAVILPLTVTRPSGTVAWRREDLGKTAVLDNSLYWDGGQSGKDADGQSIRMLGIADKNWEAKTENDAMVLHQRNKSTVGYRGWGFSWQAGPAPTQSYSWAGAAIDRTVFEIAVKNDDLTPDEEAHLISAKSPAKNQTPPDEPAAEATSAGGIDVNGPTTQLTRLQSTIKALSVRPMPSGEMLGDAEDFILTATPGKPRGDTIPVMFTSRVGPQSRMVMADVLRDINANYPHISVSKYEFSFEESSVGHDGPSIGAACGTLMLSLIENFDIDPDLAITGDVAANGKIHAIGGTAAKLRGAIAEGAKIVALPAENYEQVCDEFVYDGPATLTNVQVIGVANLNDAVAVARVDRAADLAQAIAMFADVQAMLKSDPYRIHNPAVRAKLAHIVDLAPNHFSAKLLLALSENKAPITLSAAATNYYVDLAVHTMMPGVLDSKPDVTLASPAVVHDGLAKLQKIRHCADPQFIPYVNAVQDFMIGMNQYQQKLLSQAAINVKAQAVLDQRDKLNTDRDLMEKMLHEGV